MRQLKFTPTATLYYSAFGVFTLPEDVQARAYRLERRFGRSGYLDEWCRWQWEKRRG